MPPSPRCHFNWDKLLEAGVHRIPWVASPLPAYREWGVGGLLAEKAEEREAAYVGEQWNSIFRDLAAAH